MGDASRESSFVTGLPRLDVATPDGESSSMAFKMRQAVTATAKGAELVQRTLGRNRPPGRLDVESPSPQPDAAEGIGTPAQQARFKSGQQFDIAGCNFVNVPKVIQDGLCGAYSRFDMSQEEVQRLRQDHDRFERMTRVSQDRVQTQMDALKQALLDVSVHLSQRRPGHRHHKEDKKVFGLADAISVAAGSKSPAALRPALGAFLKQQNSCALISKSPVHSPTGSRRPSNVPAPESIGSDSERSSIDEQVEVNTSRILGNAERITKVEKRQAERTTELKALKAAVTNMRSHNEKVAVKLSTVWERLNTDLSFECLRDQIVVGALEAFPQWLSGAGATEEPTVEAAVSFFQQITSHHRKVERRLDCIESDVLALSQATPDPDIAVESTKASGGPSTARARNTKSRVIISARCSVVDDEMPVVDEDRGSEPNPDSADGVHPGDAPTVGSSITSESKRDSTSNCDFMNRRKSEASLKSMAQVASLLSTQAELMEEIDEPVARSPRARSRTGTSISRLNTRASRASIDYTDLGGEAVARQLRVVAMNIEKQTSSIFSMQSQLRRLEEHVAFIDGRLSATEGMKADIDDCIEGAKREAAKIVEQKFAQQNVAFQDRKTALAEEIRAEVVDSMAQLQRSVEECLVRLDKESKTMADRIKVIFPKAYAQAQAGTSDLSVSDARLFAFESRLNELERKLAQQSSAMARRASIESAVNDADGSPFPSQQGISRVTSSRVSTLESNSRGAASPLVGLLQSARRSAAGYESRESVKNTNSWAVKRGSVDAGYRQSTKSFGRNSPTTNLNPDSRQASVTSGTAAGQEDFGAVIDRFRAATMKDGASSSSDSDEVK